VVASVNLAARLESLNKEYGTLIPVSDDVRRRAGSIFHFRPLPPVAAKGMTTETLHPNWTHPSSVYRRPRRS
jgi:adenylate cyclase